MPSETNFQPGSRMGRQGRAALQPLAARGLNSLLRDFAHVASHEEGKAYQLRQGYAIVHLTAIWAVTHCKVPAPGKLCPANEASWIGFVSAISA